METLINKKLPHKCLLESTFWDAELGLEFIDIINGPSEYDVVDIYNIIFKKPATNTFYEILIRDDVLMGECFVQDVVEVEPYTETITKYREIT